MFLCRYSVWISLDGTVWSEIWSSMKVIFLYFINPRGYIGQPSVYCLCAVRLNMSWDSLHWTQITIKLFDLKVGNGAVRLVPKIVTIKQFYSNRALGLFSQSTEVTQAVQYQLFHLCHSMSCSLKHLETADWLSYPYRCLNISKVKEIRDSQNEQRQSTNKSINRQLS